MNLLGCKQDGQIVLLLNETASTSESSVGSYMMVVQADDLPFVSMPRSSCLDDWKVHQLKVFSLLNPHLYSLFTFLKSLQKDYFICFIDQFLKSGLIVNYYIFYLFWDWNTSSSSQILYMFWVSALKYIFAHNSRIMHYMFSRIMLSHCEWRMKKSATFLTLLFLLWLLVVSVYHCISYVAWMM